MSKTNAKRSIKAKGVTNPFYHYQEIWKSKTYKEWERKQKAEFKKYRYLWKNLPKKKTPASFPLSINIEITTACNAGKNYCIMCSKHLLGHDNEYMPFKNIKKILDEAAKNGCYAVNLNGAGEPTLHPRLLDIVAYAKKKGFLDIMFHTNATLLTKKFSEKLIKAGLTKLIVSVDASDEKTYKKIRPAFNFNKVVKNIKEFVNIRNKMNLHQPIVRMTMVIMGINRNKVKEAIKFWKNYVDFISVNDCMYFDKYKAFAFNKKKITKEAKKRGMKYVCAPLYQQLSVSIDNDVIPCSTVYAKNYVPLGNLNRHSLREIWEGNRLKKLRKMHEKGFCFDIMPCRVCDLPQIELLKKMKSDKQSVLLK